MHLAVQIICDKFQYFISAQYLWNWDSVDGALGGWGLADHSS